MIKIAPSTYSLADAFYFVESNNYPLARTITPKQLEDILKVNPQFKEPTHQAVNVTLTNNEPRVLLYTNLGYPFFNNNDQLDTYKLDQKEYFFDFNIKSDTYTKTYASFEVEFSKQSNLKWTAQFDFEIIFEHFGLDGHGDFAPFVGIFKVL